MDTLDAAQRAADDFISSLNLRRDCVVLTVTPRTGTPDQYAEHLAARLQLPLIKPMVENLVTIDHSHLDKDSAQRWSSAFLVEFDQYAEKCLLDTSHASID